MVSEIQLNVPAFVIPEILWIILTGIVSIIIGIFLEKFRNKLTVLNYSMTFHPLATSTQNDYWGNIEVYHNARKINHISFVTVNIENNSNNDLQDLNIDLNCDIESQFLGQSGFYDQGNTDILLENNFTKSFINVLKRKQDDDNLSKTNPSYKTPGELIKDINWIMTNRKFYLPVLNRGTSVTINMLVENFNGLVPNVSVDILHKSLKLIRRIDKDTENRKTKGNMLIIGLIIFFIGIFLIIYSYPKDYIPICLTGVLGLMYLFIGLNIYRGVVYVKKLLR